MRYWAELDGDNVLRVVVCDTQEWLEENLGGTWIETFDAWGDPEQRYRMANPGGTYDSVNAAFIDPKPYPSWVLNETHYGWQAPTAQPVDGKDYLWDEPTTSWIEVTE